MIEVLRLATKTGKTKKNQQSKNHDSYLIVHTSNSITEKELENRRARFIVFKNKQNKLHLLQKLALKEACEMFASRQLHVCSCGKGHLLSNDSVKEKIH